MALPSELDRLINGTITKTVRGDWAEINGHIPHPEFREYGAQCMIAALRWALRGCTCTVLSTCERCKVIVTLEQGLDK